MKREATEPAEKLKVELQSSVPAAPSVSAVPDPPLVATARAPTASPTVPRVMSEEDRAVAEERASVECIRIRVIIRL